MHSLIVSLAVLAAGVPPETATPDPAHRWSSFRNNGASSVVTGNLPLHWSPVEGITWQRELPGYGQSSPVLWGDIVFLTSVEGPQKETAALHAIDLSTGDQLWSCEVSTTQQAPSSHAVARAAPTPAVDAHRVYGFFESGDVLAVSHEGALHWKRSLTAEFGEVQNHHGLGTSPAQSDDALFLNIQHKGPSYLIALDKATGETRWKVDRPSGMSWSSPIVVPQGQRELIVVSSTGSAQAYDADSGETVWTLEDVSGNSIASPLMVQDRLYLAAAMSDFDVAGHAARSNCCVKLLGDGGYEVAWRAERALCDYASPVVCGDSIYYINRAGVLHSLDAETGTEQYVKRLGGPCWATPIAAGDRIYVFGKNGETTVLRAGAEFEVLAMNRLWDPDSAPAPESYVETTGGPRHGAAEGGPPRQRRDLAARLLEHDANQDGKIQADELPEDQRRLLAAGDTNADGVLDSGELTALAEQSRQRRQSGTQGPHDPVVYAAIAGQDAIIVRTGTRLYCIRGF